MYVSIKGSGKALPFRIINHTISLGQEYQDYPSLFVTHDCAALTICNDEDSLPARQHKSILEPYAL